jgi:hypothetical protein
MRAELKGIMSPDVPDLENWHPEKEEFSILLELDIGPKNGMGSDIFYLDVVSPKHLAVLVENEPIVFGRAMLIMDSFSYKRVKKYIESWCERTHVKTWEEISEKLSRFAGYEFLDYVK